MAVLTDGCGEYDGAVALAWTDFEDARAGGDVPSFDDAGAVFDLGPVAGIDFG